MTSLSEKRASSEEELLDRLTGREGSVSCIGGRVGCQSEGTHDRTRIKSCMMKR